MIFAIINNYKYVIYYIFNMYIYLFKFDSDMHQS